MLSHFNRDHITLKPLDLYPMINKNIHKFHNHQKPPYLKVDFIIKHNLYLCT